MLHSTGWKVEKESAHGDTIYTKLGPRGNKIYKLTVSSYPIMISMIISCYDMNRSSNYSHCNLFTIQRFVFQGVIDTDPNTLFNEFVHNFENMPTWNKAINMGRKVQVIS